MAANSPQALTKFPVFFKPESLFMFSEELTTFPESHTSSQQTPILYF
jgi:hypothetical protein